MLSPPFFYDVNMNSNLWHSYSIPDYPDLGLVHDVNNNNNNDENNYCSNSSSTSNNFIVPLEHTSLSNNNSNNINMITNLSGVVTTPAGLTTDDADNLFVMGDDTCGLTGQRRDGLNGSGRNDKENSRNNHNINNDDDNSTNNNINNNSSDNADTDSFIKGHEEDGSRTGSNSEFVHTTFSSLVNLVRSPQKPDTGSLLGEDDDNDIDIGPFGIFAANIPATSSSHNLHKMTAAVQATAQGSDTSDGLREIKEAKVAAAAGVRCPSRSSSLPAMRRSSQDFGQMEQQRHKQWAESVSFDEQHQLALLDDLDHPISPSACSPTGLSRGGGRGKWWKGCKNRVDLASFHFDCLEPMSLTELYPRSGRAEERATGGMLPPLFQPPDHAPRSFCEPPRSCLASCSNTITPSSSPVKPGEPSEVTSPFHSPRALFCSSSSASASFSEPSSERGSSPMFSHLARTEALTPLTFLLKAARTNQPEAGGKGRDGGDCCEPPTPTTLFSLGPEDSGFHQSDTPVRERPKGSNSSSETMHDGDFEEDHAPSLLHMASEFDDNSDSGAESIIFCDRLSSGDDTNVHRKNDVDDINEQGVDSHSSNEYENGLATGYHSNNNGDESKGEEGLGLELLNFDQELADAVFVEDGGSGGLSAGFVGDEEGDGYAPARRPRVRSVNFASLFQQCRLERDSRGPTGPGTPAEGGGQPDTDLLLSRLHDILCAERVSQMTKTYHDIEAVTRLLEEKERDLELAARIGQTLLSKNKELSSRTETLEEQLSFAHDKVNQLRHDLSIKDELLRFYNEDLEHEVSGDSPPSDDKGLAMVNVDLLQKKVQALEDENVTLRLESTRLSSATELYEEKEKKLVVDCIQQLGEVNQQVESLAEELRLKSDDNTHQKEQITQFLGQIAELQTKIRRLTLENLDLHEKLTASSESQRKLTKEVGSMQDKYDELSEMLEEAHDELRLMRGKHKVKSTGQHHHSAFGVPTDSLASELELSLQQEISQSNRRAQSWKIFETAKAAKRAAAKSSRKHDNSSMRLSIGATPSQRDSDTSQCVSAYASDVESFASDGYSADMDSLYGSNPELGRPGIPGSNDLESALRRLAMRRANELNERDFQLEEEERKLHRDMSGATSPNSMATSDRTSGHSPGSVSSSLCTSVPGQGYKISDRLQIVKPMEGSMTLRHWQHLATPHLGGIFEPRDGIQMKGERKLDLVEESYSISDFEEDENVHDVHTRKGQELGPIYTFTDSTVASMGPYRGLGDMFNHSMASSSSNITNTSFTTDDSPRITSTPKSQANPEPQVNSQSTFTMSLGLAALLQGRENSGMGQALLRAAASSPRANKSQDLPASSSGPTSQAVTSSADAISPPTRLESLRLLPSQSTASLPPSLSLPATDSVPGSKSFQQAVQEHREKVGVTLAVKDKGMFTSGMTGKGFLQQLKTKGMSLYGLWGGGGNGDGSSSDSQTASMSLPVTSSLDVAGVGDSEQAKTATEMVFSPDGGSGVLGAMTNFRRNGIF